MERREFLRTSGLAGLGTAAWSALSGPRFAPSRSTGGAPDTAERPNIVVILADDMGFSDVGCYGAEIDTPTLDGLAEDGLRFTQFYNAARCCPTRASLMTGLYPHQAGVGHMRADLERPAYRGHLNDRCVTIAEVLGAEGYQTMMSGKWHLGKEYAHWPNARGFDHFSGLLEGVSDYFNPPPNRTIVKKNAPYAPHSKGVFKPESQLMPDFYMTDFLSSEAVDFVERGTRNDDPFFLYLSYTAPHWPIQAREDDIQKYISRYQEGWDPIRRARYERQVEQGIIDEQWSLPDRDPRVPDWSEVDDQRRWTRMMATYAGMIDRMDQGIGRVVDALEAAGELENTLLFFVSDNGAAAIGLDRTPEAKAGSPESYMGYHRPWANVSDTPFRRYKIWTHEGGIATPGIAHWPDGIVNPGRQSDRLSHVADVLPTCLDAAGVHYPSTYDGREIVPADGASLMPAFRDQQPASGGHESLFFTHTDNHAIRTQQWKLVTSDGRKTWELYDMVADRTETTDVSDEHPEIVARLADRHQEWSDRVGVLPWSEYRKIRKRQKSE
ncbi:MAG: arylsulfatase [Salinibacter sp.]|uniref:arylsulfatase n=1 Tax=Salinibacter sp. TaxID=2065818 RepID=UPI0035D501F4